MVDWLTYVDLVGSISYEDFLLLPSSATNYIMTIRISQKIKSLRLELQKVPTKGQGNQEYRKKLNNQLTELESFF